MPNLIEPVQPESVPVKWKRGQIHPETGLVFLYYNDLRKDGTRTEKWGTVEEYENEKRKSREYAHNRWATNKSRCQEIARKSYAKLKEDPERILEHRKKAKVKRAGSSRKYWERAKQDPERLNKRYTQTKEWRAKKKEDLEYQERLRERQREKYQREAAARREDPEKAEAFKAKMRGHAKKQYYEVVQDPERHQRYKKKARERIVEIRSDPVKNAEFNRKYAEYIEDRKATDPVFALAMRVRSTVSSAFKRKSSNKTTRTEHMLGCSFSEFHDHIVAQFCDGMSMENRKAWHIDHIVPVGLARTESDVVLLNHHKNLRPLWGHENLQKNAKPPTMEECPEYLREWLRERLSSGE